MLAQEHLLECAHRDVVAVFIGRNAGSAQLAFAPTDLSADLSPKERCTENQCGSSEQQGVKFIERNFRYVEHSPSMRADVAGSTPMRQSGCIETSSEKACVLGFSRPPGNGQAESLCPVPVAVPLQMGAASVGQLVPVAWMCCGLGSTFRPVAYRSAGCPVKSEASAPRYSLSMGRFFRPGESAQRRSSHQSPRQAGRTVPS